MKQYRLNRLFNPASGNCLDVAIDHGVFNVRGFLQGIENIESTVRTLVACAPDAIQLNVGQAPVLQSIPGRNKPSLVMRTDVANTYSKELPRHLFSRMIGSPVDQALQLDAVCVVVNLFGITGQPEVQDHCIQNILELKPACDRYGMPLMIEPLVFKSNSESGGYMVDGDLEKILPLVRQATELGADVIKADPTDHVTDYRHVVEVARVPVLVRGGGKADDLGVLRRTAEIMSEGVRGLVYGRNIIQHPNPAGMTRALMDIVHSGVSAEEAARHLAD
jgi:DhnA family fructose-bisphosphate aldolase class Ia